MDSLLIFAPFMPLTLAIIFGCLQLLMQVFLPAQRRNLLTYSALVQMAFLGLVTVLAYTSKGHLQALGPAAQSAALQSFAFLDGVALFFYLLLICAGFVTVLGSAYYLEREQLVPGEYYALLFFALAGMMVLASGGDLITLFLGLEIMSMSVYILVGYRRNELRSNEASFKYFLLGSLASALMLYGIALTYGVTGTVQLNEIQRYFLSQPLTALSAIGMLLILAGLCPGAEDLRPGLYRPAQLLVRDRFAAGGGHDDHRQCAGLCPAEHQAHAGLLQYRPHRLSAGGDLGPEPGQRHPDPGRGSVLPVHLRDQHPGRVSGAHLPQRPGRDSAADRRLRRAGQASAL